MRATQESGPPPNSAAIPLPTAFWDPEFRCRPFAQLVSKWLIYLMLPTWRGSFGGLRRDLSLSSGTNRMGSATVGPRHASSRCGAGGWGLRVGAQAVDEVGEAELPVAPQPI